MIAVRKRTMDSAPTMPRESVRLELMSMITIADTMVSRIKLRLNEREYTTPANVFL